MYYYGVHSTDKLNDGYLGTGTLIKQAIELEGRKNFKRKILFNLPTRAEAFEKEAELVTLTEVNDQECYNIALGGGVPTTKEVKYHSNQTFEVYQPKPGEYLINNIRNWVSKLSLEWHTVQ